MPIVLISESLLSRSTAIDRRLLRDRVLCSFCVRMTRCQAKPGKDEAGPVGLCKGG